MGSWGSDCPFDITAIVDADENGALRVVSLTVEERPGGPKITASSLRNVPIRELLADIETDFPDECDPFSAWRMPAGKAGSARLNNQILAAVADVYRLAADLGADPTNKVAEVFRKPRSTAGRWVMEARRRGYLEAV